MFGNRNNESSTHTVENLDVCALLVVFIDDIKSIFI